MNVTRAIFAAACPDWRRLPRILKELERPPTPFFTLFGRLMARPMPRFAVGLGSSILRKMRSRRSSLRRSRQGTALMIAIRPANSSLWVICPMSQPPRGAHQKLASVNQNDDSVASVHSLSSMNDRG
jgi:hypothetical protein